MIGIVIAGAILILVLNLVAPLVSMLTGIPIAYAMIGSLLIYFSVGYSAARETGSVGMAALAGAIAGLVEATLGWRIYSMLGLVRPSGAVVDDVMGVFAHVAVVALVTASGMAIGIMGGMVSKRRLA